MLRLQLQLSASCLDVWCQLAAPSQTGTSPMRSCKQHFNAPAKEQVLLTLGQLVGVLQTRFRKPSEPSDPSCRPRITIRKNSPWPYSCWPLLQPVDERLRKMQPMLQRPLHVWQKVQLPLCDVPHVATLSAAKPQVVMGRSRLGAKGAHRKAHSRRKAGEKQRKDHPPAAVLHKHLVAGLLRARHRGQARGLRAQQALRPARAVTTEGRSGRRAEAEQVEGGSASQEVPVLGAAAPAHEDGRRPSCSDACRHSRTSSAWTQRCGDCSGRCTMCSSRALCFCEDLQAPSSGLGSSGSWARSC
mmetsp:Transcript_32692/g.94123  ORF Transcript_32692/g.94123 Transcript_32692/m.94123 type:complete len:301 (-) Transcript_32692:397-1299(-)